MVVYRSCGVGGAGRDNKCRVVRGAALFLISLFALGDVFSGGPDMLNRILCAFRS